MIRTQQPICILHDAAKAEFIRRGVNPDFINPPYGEHSGELKLAGFFKCKDQDICILPNNITAEEEILMFDGILRGQKDPYGFELTERILSVNVRSQLSSIAKILTHYTKEHLQKLLTSICDVPKWCWVSFI